MQQFVSMVQKGHTFARRGTSNGLNKAMLYTDAQIADSKCFCCQPIYGTVGIRQNIQSWRCPCHPWCFKYLGVTRKDSGTYPKLPGPILLCGKSDVTTYMDFSHLSKLPEGSQSIYTSIQLGQCRGTNECQLQGISSKSQ